GCSKAKGTQTDAADTHRHCGLELLEVLSFVCKGKGFYQGHLSGPHLYSDLQRYC
uniref:Uncharacterized protein n=1 Tax=Leptobrachium leishanense TaxID=445787 RepID=A0A8C5LQC8_9ANUR